MHWITTTQVLTELREHDESPAWNDLCRHFFPVIEHFARQLGLSRNQAQDTAQETLIAFLKAFRAGKYDRSKGRLSAWLFGIARNQVRHLQAQHAPPGPPDNGPGAASQARAENGTLKLTWETQWQRILLARCLARVQQETDPAVYEAFRLYALEEQAPAQVARHLHISCNAVYIAKSRILSRLRALIQQLDNPEAL